MDPKPIFTDIKKRPENSERFFIINHEKERETKRLQLLYHHPF